MMRVIENAKRNIKVGVINKIVVLLCPFIIRTIIQRTLGAEYLGLSSLFKSILQMLNLSELGMSGAIIYSMYEPVAKNDQEKVNALLNLYRRVYHIIGSVILFLGILLIPLLPKLIENDIPEGLNITTIYLIYLFDSVISYFLYAYRTSLLIVYQRDDVLSLTSLIVTIGLTIMQMLALLVFRDFYLYVLLIPIFTILNNIRIGYFSQKMFPQYSCNGTVSKETMDDIKIRVAGSFIVKACMVTRNSLDSICLSMFAGLIIVAKYNNYYIIIASVSTILLVMSSAFKGGVGNHTVIKSGAENFEELKKLDFVYMNISGWCAAFILCLSQPFMRLWMGENMTLDMPVVCLMTLYFYLLKIGDMHSIYIECRGLWWEHRYRSICEALLNFILNVLLGLWFGLYGVILATIATIFLINFLWGSKISFRYYFGEIQLKDYYLYHFKYFLLSCFLCGTCFFMCELLPADNIFLNFGFRFMICVFVPLFAYLFIYRNNGNLVFIKSMIKKRPYH